MTPGNIETLIMIIGLLAMSGLGLIGLKIFVTAWIKRKEIAAGGDAAGLAEAVEALRADTYERLEHLAGEVSELQERVDFAERMLTKGSFGPHKLESGKDEA